MPNYGTLIFGAGCLRADITAECKSKLLSLQTNGRLSDPLQGELDALFESDTMVQVQMDNFVLLLGSLRDDLRRVFDGEQLTPRKIKWAIDTKVQQGTFPGDADIKRLRTTLATLDTTAKLNAARGLIGWYDGLCHTVDQGGIRLDCAWNVTHWENLVNEGSLTDEEIDLLHLTWLRSRTSTGMSGYWQALTFERRAKAALGVGSVSGNRSGD